MAGIGYDRNGDFAGGDVVIIYIYIYIYSICIHIYIYIYSTYIYIYMIISYHILSCDWETLIVAPWLPIE